MKDLINRFYDPGEQGGGGGGSPEFGFSDVVPEEKVETPSPEPKIEDKPAEDPGDKTAIDDPEFEMDFEENEGSGKAKYKLSALRDQAKWLHENRNMLSATLKIREESQKNPTFGKALQTIIQKAYNEKGEFQAQAVDGILQRLEAQEAKIEDKIEDKSDDIADMESMLSELDEESPHAKILQKNILAAKKIRADLKASLDQNKKFQERLDGLEKFKGDLTKEKERAIEDEKVKQASDLYWKEFGTLTDKAKSDGYKFVDDDEKADFDRALRIAVAERSRSIKTDQDFVKVVRECAKAIYDKVSKRREAIVNDHLRKKNGPPKAEPKKEEKEDTRSFSERLSGVDFSEVPK